MPSRRAPNRSTALFALLSFFSMVHLAHAEVFSLQALESRALSRRNVLASAHAAAEGARAGASLVRAESNPRFAVDLQSNVASGGQLVEVVDTSGNHYLVQGTQPLGESDAFMPQLRYGALVSMDTRIFDFGRGRALEDAAQARVDAASAGQRATRARVIRDVRRAYLEWVAAFAAYSLVEKDLNETRERRRAVEAAVRDGLQAPRDLAAVRYEESLADVESSRARARLRDAELNTAQAIGEALPAGAEPDLRLLDRDVPRPADTRTPELDALRRQMDAATATVRAEGADRLPVLGAGIQAGLQGQNDRFFPTYRAGLSLRIPIWDGGVASARSDMARAEADEIDARAKEYRNALEMERVRARADLAAAVERLALATTLVENALARLQASEERYRMGEVAPDIVEQARSDWRRAKHEVLLAKVSRLDAAFRLADPGASLPLP